MREEVLVAATAAAYAAVAAISWPWYAFGAVVLGVAAYLLLRGR